MRFIKVLAIVLAVLAALILIGASICVWLMISMPGKSFEGKPPQLTKLELATKENLTKNLEKLSIEIGERNVGNYNKLNDAAKFIESEFTDYGYDVASQYYDIEGVQFRNLEATLIGASKPDEIIVVGAHYDTVPGCPGADDNGTGIVSTLELARLLKERIFDRTIRFVAFTNEEYPFFWSKNMGSQVYARRCLEKKEKIVGMIAIETIGYYSNEEGSQLYPINTLGVYPNKGNFVFFVGNLKSRDFVTQSIGAFRSKTKVPSFGIAAIDNLRDIARSDNKSFWDCGYPGFMITDTANFRNPHYHSPTDTVDKIDFDNLSRVVIGFDRMLGSLAGPKSQPSSIKK